MFKTAKTLFLVGLLVSAILTLFPIPASAGTTRLYSESTIVSKGVELTTHNYTWASDNQWYNISSIKETAYYKIIVRMMYKTLVDSASLEQIYVFSEAHVEDGLNPVAIQIYNYNTSFWEPCFNVSTTTDAEYNHTITENLAHYINIINTVGEITLQVYYTVKLKPQSIFQDHTYIELTAPPQAPVADFTWEPETPYTGETVTFNATASYDPDGTIVSYVWDFGDNTTGGGNITTHAYTDDGNYTVTLNVTDNDGLSHTASDTITVLNRPPVVTFTENATSVLTYESIHFDASGSSDLDGNITSYFWDFGDETNATGVIVDYAYADNGTYTVTLTVTDDDGATNSTTAPKTVLNRSPVANFTWEPEVPRINEVMTFNATASYDLDGNITSYYWDFGDEINATVYEPMVNHTYTTIGDFMVTLTVTDDDGATNSTSATLTVSGRDVAVYLPIEVTFPLNATAAYPGWPVNITVTVGNEGPVAETIWVAVYYNRTATEWVMIENRTGVPLDAYANKTLTFVWNTTDVPPSVVDHKYTNYTIKAEAGGVPDEIDTTDNVKVDGAVRIRLLGDANGNGVVNIADASIIGKGWQQGPGDPDYDPLADFNYNGIINIADAAFIGKNWQKTI